MARVGAEVRRSSPQVEGDSARLLERCWKAYLRLANHLSEPCPSDLYTLPARHGNMARLGRIL